MHTKRLVIIIGLITFLGLITAWQQVQTIRWGYQISELATLRDKLFTGEQSIKIKLANLKSPQNLMIYAQSKQIPLTSSDEMNTGTMRIRLENGTNSFANLNPR